MKNSSLRWRGVLSNGAIGNTSEQFQIRFNHLQVEMLSMKKGEIVEKMSSVCYICKDSKRPCSTSHHRAGTHSQQMIINHQSLYNHDSTIYFFRQWLFYVHKFLREDTKLC